MDGFYWIATMTIVFVLIIGVIIARQDWKEKRSRSGSVGHPNSSVF